MHPSDSSVMISVCIQTYQQAPYIRQAVQSVLDQQTDFSYEIILGEDESTDGTRTICEALAREHPDRIRLYLRSEKDKIHIGGIKTGRFNFLSNLKAARGKYIALLDGDDYWIDPYKLQKQVEAMEKDETLSICFCGVLVENREDRHPYPAVPRGARLLTGEDLARNCFIQTCAVLFRNPGFEQVPAHFWDAPFLDYALYLHLATRGNILYLPAHMAVYRYHEEGAWTLKQKDNKMRRDWDFLDRVIPEYEGAIRKALEKHRKEKIRTLLRWYIRQQRTGEWRSTMEEIARRCPEARPSRFHYPLNKIRYQVKSFFVSFKNKKANEIPAAS